MSCIIDIHKKNGKRAEYDEYIGRAVDGTEFTEDSIWANPYTYKMFGDQAVILYESYIRAKIKKEPKLYNLEKLRNKRLGCWCITTDKIYPIKCHGQVLMKLLLEKFGGQQIIMRRV